MAGLEHMGSAFDDTNENKFSRETQDVNIDKMYGETDEFVTIEPFTSHENAAGIQQSEIIRTEEVTSSADDIFDPSSTLISGLVSTSRPLVTAIDDDEEPAEVEESKNVQDAFFKMSEEALLDEFDPVKFTEPSFTNSNLAFTASANDEFNVLEKTKSASETMKDLIVDDSNRGYSFGDTEVSASSGGRETPPDSQTTKDILPNICRPKIETELVGGFAAPKASELETRACEPSAQSEPREGDIMESTGVSSTEKNNSNKSSSNADGCPFAPGALFNPEKLNPTVAELVYWKDTKKSGIVFGSSLLLLLSITYFSLISVVSYAALAALSITTSFRIYKSILQAVQKSNDGHPFKEYLEMDINVPSERVQQTVDVLVEHINCTSNRLRSLFLVEDLVDSLKLGVFLWCMTYVGAWFNGMTLIILSLVASFAMPKFYENNKTQIDHYLDLVRNQVNDVLGKVKSKIPLGKKKEQ